VEVRRLWFDEHELLQRSFHAEAPREGAVGLCALEPRNATIRRRQCQLSPERSRSLAAATWSWPVAWGGLPRASVSRLASGGP
jgi:hypothetical protein